MKEELGLHHSGDDTGADIINVASLRGVRMEGRGTQRPAGLLCHAARSPQSRWTMTRQGPLRLLHRPSVRNGFFSHLSSPRSNKRLFEEKPAWGSLPTHYGADVIVLQA